MLKNYGIIKELSREIASAAEDVCEQVFADYEEIAGREEEITAQLRGEINRRLLSNVARRLQGVDIRGCTVRVATLKKRQENKVGADLVGVIELTHGAKTVSKAFLAQAKVGSIFTSDRGERFVRSSNAKLLSQCRAMLKLSSDSFVFVYSKDGVVSIPAFQVVLGNTNTIDTASYPYHSFGRFIEEFVKCFIGDHLISPVALRTTSLEEYAARLHAKAALVIRVKLEEEGR